MNARPEQVTVTDPAHPLHGRVFMLVSLASAPGPGSCAQVAYRGDIVLKIPVEATSLRPAAASMPASKLTLHAIRELVRLAVRGGPADPGAPDQAGPRRPRAAPVATARGEVSHERGTRHGPTPGPQGRDLRPSVQPAPGADQPGEPAPAVRAPPARSRAR